MKAPKLPSLFKLRKYNYHRQFDYQPRYYNEQAEKLQKRQRQIERELELEKKLGKTHEQVLRDRISESWGRREMARHRRNSSRRILIILVVICLLMYFLYTKLDFII